MLIFLKLKKIYSLKMIIIFYYILLKQDKLA